jgi:hypothetical protein
MEDPMRLIPSKKIVAAGILAAVACGLLLASVVPSSVSAPRASVLVGEAAISPLAMMRQAPLDLPVQQYDSH